MKRRAPAQDGGDDLSENDSRLKDLLDGKLSAEEIAEDPVLASLAERIYGTEFLDQVGISRGATKRALAEQFTEMEGDDLLIDDIPEAGLPLPMPEDMPPVPMAIAEDDEVEGRPMIHKLKIASGGVGLLAIATNLFYGFGNFLSTCSAGLHETCGVSLKLNWLEFHRMDEVLAWSPTGSIGIPDIGLATFCCWLIIQGIRQR
jgi:hypothetical protein